METHPISTEAVINQINLSDQGNFWLTNHLGESVGIGVERRLNIPHRLHKFILLICNCIHCVLRKPWISIHPCDVADRVVICLREVDRESIPGDVNRLCNQLTSLRARLQRGQAFSDHPGLNGLIGKLERLAASLQIEKELDEIELHIKNDSPEKRGAEVESKMPNPADIPSWELSSEIKSLNAYELSRLPKGPKPAGDFTTFHIMEPYCFKLLYFLDSDKTLPTIEEHEHKLFAEAMSKLSRTTSEASWKWEYLSYDNQGAVLNCHIRQILHYLYLKRRHWQNEQNPEIKKNSAVAIRTLTQSTLRKLITVGNSPIDRALVDISSIEVDLFQDFYGFDALNVLPQVALQLYAYRLDLIKEAVKEVVGQASGAGDPSFYEMIAIKGVHHDLGFPMPDNYSALSVPRYSSLFLPRNCEEIDPSLPTHTKRVREYLDTIRQRFFLRYQPVAWLMKIINQHDEPQLFSVMSQWYQSKVLEPLDEPDKARIIAKLGINSAEGLGQCTPASVIYFLLHQDIIHAPVRDSSPSQA